MGGLTVVISWALASLVVSRRIPPLWKPDMKTNKLQGILRCSYDRASDEIRGLRRGLSFLIAAGSTVLDPLFSFHLIFKPEFFHSPFTLLASIACFEKDEAADFHVPFFPCERCRSMRSSDPPESLRASKIGTQGG